MNFLLLSNIYEFTKSKLILRKQKIQKLIFSYLNDRNQPNHRYASFDYCYGYFNSFKNKKLIASEVNLEKSCLHLGFYLASWGMMRGSGFLLQKNFRYYEEFIRMIAFDCDDVWGIDVPDYDNESKIKILENTYNKFDCMIKDQNSKIVIVTKIMLGVFGCVPAYDKYFTQSFRSISKGRCGFRKFTDSLKEILCFYTENKEAINNCIENIGLLKVDKRTTAKLFYTRAKIIDMIGFQMGLETKKSN